MARKRTSLIQVSANLPENIVERWEDMLKKEYGVLPFDMTRRLELAILEHTRMIQRRLKEPTQPSPLPLALNGLSRDDYP
jgi:hypothetical protein